METTKKNTSGLLHLLIFLLMIRHPPRSTHFPYSTLSGSAEYERVGEVLVDDGVLERPPRRSRSGCRRRHVIPAAAADDEQRSEEHTSELQSRQYLVCRLLLEKKINGVPMLGPRRAMMRVV